MNPSNNDNSAYNMNVSMSLNMCMNMEVNNIVSMNSIKGLGSNMVLGPEYPSSEQIQCHVLFPVVIELMKLRSDLYHQGIVDFRQRIAKNVLDIARITDNNPGLGMFGDNVTGILAQSCSVLLSQVWDIYWLRKKAQGEVMNIAKERERNWEMDYLKERVLGDWYTYNNFNLNPSYEVMEFLAGKFNGTFEEVKLWFDNMKNIGDKNKDIVEISDDDDNNGKMTYS